MINLQELLSYDNPRRQEYEELVRLEEYALKTFRMNRMPITNFSRVWDEIIGSQTPKKDSFSKERKNVQRFIKVGLTGEILIDLGSGPINCLDTDNLTSIAKMLGASAYIGVEKFPSDLSLALDLYKNIADPRLIESRAPMDHLEVKADMLEFISRVKSNSANITINGIDASVLWDTRSYSEALAREIARVVRVGGIAFGHNSDVSTYLGNYGLKRMEFSYLSGSLFFVFQKPEDWREKK